MAALEEARNLHEDLERLEQAIADRVLEEPKHIRDHLARDHEIRRFLDYMEHQSAKLLEVYRDPEDKITRQIQNISTGDPYESFYKQLEQVKAHHRNHPGERVENLEKAYKKLPSDEAREVANQDITRMFTGEEGFGRFFDLTQLHDQYLNLPGIRDNRRVTYLQYLDIFDAFTPPQCNLKYHEKVSDHYFKYVSALAEYLETFMRRTRPLENLDKLFATFDEEFEQAWEKDEVPGWEKKAKHNGDTEMGGTDEGIWCADCRKEFAKQSVYDAHLSGKKHKKNAENRKAEGDVATNGLVKDSHLSRLKELAIAAKEFRIKKLAAAMQINRSDTKVNVERKQAMTERERQAELEALYAEVTEDAGGEQGENKDEEDGEEKIYNPLKLPLAWDGKPIPYWLYKLHGLGVEFNCEICGNFVYMGRRAFDKHFSEPRHVHGLRCLGITSNTALFREISGIEDALKLWKKIQQDKKKEKLTVENVVQMEDSEGNVMPEKVYYDLQRQGLL